MTRAYGALCPFLWCVPYDARRASRGSSKATGGSVTEHFRVCGGARLTGEVDVVGAKNSVLKLMAAALLAEGTTTLTNCPEILDVPLMADVLRGLGCRVTIDGDTTVIDTPAELNHRA